MFPILMKQRRLGPEVRLPAAFGRRIDAAGNGELTVDLFAIGFGARMSETMKILISGASGLVGNALTRVFREKGYSVARFVRPGKVASACDVEWDPMAASVDVPAMEGADAVVNLNGASIGEGRWTPERKAILRSSRIDSTRVLVDALLQMREKPRVFISASATGYYGNRGEEILTESSEGGTDFLALLARDWEAEAMRAAAGGIRTVILRFGVIFSAEGGALSQMLMPFKFGVWAGVLGSGQQWLSWIALEDAVGVICAAIAERDDWQAR